MQIAVPHASTPHALRMFNYDHLWSRTRARGKVTLGGRLAVYGQPFGQGRALPWDAARVLTSCFDSNRRYSLPHYENKHKQRAACEVYPADYPKMGTRSAIHLHGKSAVMDADSTQFT
jgi:hypothetical protein